MPSPLCITEKEESTPDPCPPGLTGASCTAARGGKQARSPSTGEWMKEKVTNTRWNSTQLQESDLSICWKRHGSGDHSAQDAKPGTKRQILKGSFSA